MDLTIDTTSFLIIDHDKVLDDYFIKKYRYERRKFIWNIYEEVEVITDDMYIAVRTHTVLIAKFSDFWRHHNILLIIKKWVISVISDHLIGHILSSVRYSQYFIIMKFN